MIERWPDRYAAGHLQFSVLKLQIERPYGSVMSTLDTLLATFGVKVKKASPPTADDVATALQAAEKRRTEAEGAVAKAEKLYRAAVVNRDHVAADAAEQERKLAQREGDALVVEMQALEERFVALVKVERDEAHARLLAKHRDAARKAFDTLSERLEAALEASENAIETYRQAQAELGPYSERQGALNVVFATTLTRGSVNHWREGLQRVFDPPAAVPKGPPAGFVVIRAERVIPELSLTRGDVTAQPAEVARQLVQRGAASFIEPVGAGEQDTGLPPASLEPTPEPDENGRIAVRILKPIDQGASQGGLAPGDISGLPAELATRLVGEGRAEFVRADQ
jgi:hypothetical protein